MRAGGSPGRWTADTEVAFLLALRLLGSLTTACAAIGRSLGATQKRRARLPAFEARCRAALDAHRLDAAAAQARVDRESGVSDEDANGGVMNNRVRFDGWTPVRQRAFLRALSRTGGYSKACRAVGLSRTSADRMRAPYPAFAAACQRALDQSAGTLEQIAYERAIEGWDEPIIHAGQIVGQRRRYSEPLLRLLLQREDRRVAATAASGSASNGTGTGTGNAVGAAPTGRRGVFVKKHPTSEEVDAILLRKLDVLARRGKAEERERLRVWADDMVARGLAP